MIKSGRRKWAEHVTHRGKKRSTFGFLVGKAERNRQLGKPRHMWEDTVKIDLKKQ
jgi:hypothetical protein